MVMLGPRARAFHTRGEASLAGGLGGSLLPPPDTCGADVSSAWEESENFSSAGSCPYGPLLGGSSPLAQAHSVSQRLTVLPAAGGKDDGTGPSSCLPGMKGEPSRGEKARSSSLSRGGFLQTKGAGLRPSPSFTTGPRERGEQVQSRAAS